MIRTQVQLTESQMVKLRQAARAQGVSLAEMIRRLVDRGIASELPDRRTVYAQAVKRLGEFKDEADASDVGERHDEYLERAYR